MKESSTFALLALIAGAPLVLASCQGNDAPATANAPATEAAAHTAAPARPAHQQPPPNTFDPTVPPTSPPVTNGPSTSIHFPVMEHDFGKVMQNSENKYTFTFTNTGKLPLMISNAVGSCGCTVPDYPKEPIAPGADGVIHVVYKPGQQQGNQQKTVTVTANTQPPQTLLHIMADVQVAH